CIAGAPAELAREHVDDLLARRLALSCQEILGRQEDPGRAEAALEGVMPIERGLQGRELAGAREPFHGNELRSVHLSGEQQARADGRAIEPDRARAADAVLAPDVGSREPEAVANEVREQEARLHLLAVAAAVHRDADRDHAARSLARATARSTRTR